MKSLYDNEVRERIEAGQVNRNINKPVITYGQILRNNVFTLFNLINCIVFVLLIITGSYKNTLFMNVVLFNTLIGIIQEIRAKKTIDKMSILVKQRVTAIRNGKEVDIDCDDIVRDDLIILNTGMQIPVDAVVEETDYLEVDESLLSGESDPVRKNAGDKLLSGSFISSGSAYVVATAVGAESYSAKLVSKIKRVRHKSKLIFALKRIIKWIGFIILPIGVTLFVAQSVASGGDWRNAISQAAAGVIGMIPEGLILLTSAALALGVIRLARKKAVVKELESVELLSRVDTVCFDKTGTITTGNLTVSDMIPVEGCCDIISACNLKCDDVKAEIGNIIGNIMASLSDDNFTAKALRQKYEVTSHLKAISTLPFSSKRKYSAVTFENTGCFIIGAPEFVIKNCPISEKASSLAEDGYRVLALAYSKEFCDNIDTTTTVPVALILLSDVLRDEAADIFEFFKKQNTDIKIISGDNLKTVCNAVAATGLNVSYSIDMSLIPENTDYKTLVNFSVFARVTPEQKRRLIRAMRECGRTVAMAGDGVNDVLALKEADCALSLASGCGAARDVSDIVLLNSDLSSMPSIIAEGRRVVGNIERVAGLYLTKTVSSILLSILFIAIGFFLGGSYPFQPIHLTMISSMFIGIPSAVLALYPCNEPIGSNFLNKVIADSLPGGITNVLALIAIEVLAAFSVLPEEKSTITALLITAFISLLVLIKAAMPLDKFKSILIVVLTSIFVVMTFFNSFFDISSINLKVLVITAILAFLSSIGIYFLRKFTKFIFLTKN